MSGEHTPGPWAWFGNRGGGVYLATPDRGRRYVMSFRRYGMNGAQPAFCVGNIMVPAAELVSFAVGDRSVRGFKQADSDTSVYRYDVDQIDHPDARLIAAAPTLLEALERIAAPLDCGCVPCRGQCRSQYALQIELEERQDIARAAIASACVVQK